MWHTLQNGKRSRGAGTAWYGLRGRVSVVTSAIHCKALDQSGYAQFRNSD